MSYVYLASPYSAPADTMREARFCLAVAAVARIATAGIPVYSPIVHWHPVAEVWSLPKGVDFWWRQNLCILRHATEVWVYQLPGWERSVGIQKEVAAANDRKFTVRYVGLGDEAMNSAIESFRFDHPTLVGVEE